MHTISSTWPELLGQFFQVFTKPGAEIFLSLMTGCRLNPRRDCSPGLCCAHPAKTSLDMISVTSSARSIAHHAGQPVGQQIPGRTGLGASLITSN